MNEVVDSSFYLNKTYIGVLTLLSVLIGYRKFGGFYYRCTMVVLSLFTMATYGFFAAIVLGIVGRTDLVNWSVARGFYYLGGFFWDVTVKPEGLENLNKVKGPVIYVCNHQSSMDILLMGKVYPKNTAIVAKKAIKYYPFMGWFMILSNAIFLDRKNRQNAVKEARQAAIDIHKKNTNVWLFPEGTRGHEAEATLLPFKKGAFYMAVQAKVPIIPVVIENYNHLYSAKAKRFVPGTLRCKVLPPISTEGVNEESADIEKLANLCRDQMLVALKEISSPIVGKKTQ